MGKQTCGVKDEGKLVLCLAGCAAQGLACHGSALGLLRFCLTACVFTPPPGNALCVTGCVLGYGAGFAICAYVNYRCVKHCNDEFNTKPPVPVPPLPGPPPPTTEPGEIA